MLSEGKWSTASFWSLKRAATVTEFELRSMRNLKTGIIGQFVIEPIVWTAFLAGGLHGARIVVGGDAGSDTGYLDFVFPGILGIFAMRGFARAIYRTTIDRRWGLLALKLIYGTGPLGYVLGMNTTPLVGFMVQGAIAAVIALLLGASISAVGLSLTLMTGLLSVAFWTSLALLVTAGVSNYQQRDLIVTLSILPLTFSAPIFFQLDSAPQYLRIIGYLNPLTYQVGAMRDVYLDGVVATPFVVSGILAVVALVLAVFVVRFAELMPSEH